MAATAWSDGLFLDGVSPRSLSRGGTNQGYADNGEILFDNPAAMSNVKGDGLFEADLVGLEQTAATPGPEECCQPGVHPLPQMSYIRRSADGDFAFGIGMFTPAGFSTNYNMNAKRLFPWIAVLRFVRYVDQDSARHLLQGHRSIVDRRYLWRGRQLHVAERTVFPAKCSVGGHADPAGHSSRGGDTDLVSGHAVPAER